MRLSQLAQLRGMHVDVIRRMVDNVAFISDHYRAIQTENKISDEWSFVSNVFDRIILIIFILINIAGTAIIALNSPLFYDDQLPLPIVSQIRSFAVKKDISSWPKFVRIYADRKTIIRSTHFRTI